MSTLPPTLERIIGSGEAPDRNAATRLPPARSRLEAESGRRLLRQEGWERRRDYRAGSEPRWQSTQNAAGCHTTTDRTAGTRTRHSGHPQKAQRSLGSERGLATPSPDGKGEITLGPSKKIMPLDPYSTLGRSCEPAYQVDLPGAGLRRRHAPAGGWPVPGGHEASCSVTWPASSPEVRPVRSRGLIRWPGGHGRGLAARPEAPNSGIHRCLPALVRPA